MSQCGGRAGHGAWREPLLGGLESFAREEYVHNDERRRSSAKKIKTTYKTRKICEGNGRGGRNHP